MAEVSRYNMSEPIDNNNSGKSDPEMRPIPLSKNRPGGAVGLGEIPSAESLRQNRQTDALLGRTTPSEFTLEDQRAVDEAEGTADAISAAIIDARRTTQGTSSPLEQSTSEQKRYPAKTSVWRTIFPFQPRKKS